MRCSRPAGSIIRVHFINNSNSHTMFFKIHTMHNISLRPTWYTFRPPGKAEPAASTLRNPPSLSAVWGRSLDGLQFKQGYFFSFGSNRSLLGPPFQTEQSFIPPERTVVVLYTVRTYLPIAPLGLDMENIQRKTTVSITVTITASATRMDPGPAGVGFHTWSTRTSTQGVRHAL